MADRKKVGVGLIIDPDPWKSCDRCWLPGEDLCPKEPNSEDSTT
jgi:hypothetical protein